MIISQNLSGCHFVKHSTHFGVVQHGKFERLSAQRVKLILVLLEYVQKSAATSEKKENQTLVELEWLVDEALPRMVSRTPISVSKSHDKDYLGLRAMK